MTAHADSRPSATRTKKRSRSGAHTPCPHCAKQLRGQKGLDAHIAQTHAEAK